MLPAISLALLTILAAPSHTARASDAIVLSQQQQQPPQRAAPKRDCEKKQDEGVSA